MKIKNSWIKKTYLLYIPIFLVAILFMLTPLYDLVKQSLIVKNPYDYNDENIGINNFKKIFNDTRFITAITNTLILLFVVSPIIMMLFFFIALLISKLSFYFFKNTFIAIIFSQLFISSYSIGIVFLVLFGSKTNALNSIFDINIDWNNPNTRIFPFLQLVIFYTWTMSVISILLFVLRINKINQNKFLMAKIDNINLWKQIKFIYMPNLKKIIYIQIYLFIFQSLFFYPTIYEDPFILNCQTLSTYIIHNLHIQSSPLNWSLAAAAAVILLIISLITMATILSIKFIFNNLNNRSKK